MHNNFCKLIIAKSRCHIYSLIFIYISKGVHGCSRATGDRINTLPHMLADMDKPYDLVALPTECPEGRYLGSATKFKRGN